MIARDREAIRPEAQSARTARRWPDMSRLDMAHDASPGHGRYPRDRALPEARDLKWNLERYLVRDTGEPRTARGFRMAAASA